MSCARAVRTIYVAVPVWDRARVAAATADVVAQGGAGGGPRFVAQPTAIVDTATAVHGAVTLQLADSSAVIDAIVADSSDLLAGQIAIKIDDTAVSDERARSGVRAAAERPAWHPRGTARSAVPAPFGGISEHMAARGRQQATCWSTSSRPEAGTAAALAATMIPHRNKANPSPRNKWSPSGSRTFARSAVASTPMTRRPLGPIRCRT